MHSRDPGFLHAIRFRDCCVGGSGGWYAGAQRGWISAVWRCGDPGLTTNSISALRRRLALADRTKCVDTLYDIRRRIGCKVVRFVRL